LATFDVHPEEEILATHQMRGVMLFPSDAENARVVVAIGIVQELANAERKGDSTATSTLLASLGRLGGFSTLEKSLPPNEGLDYLGPEISGRIAGAILGWVLAFGATKRRREHATVRRVISELERARKTQAQSLRGRKIPSSRTAIKSAWRSHSRVAHLWLAQWRVENIRGEARPTFQAVAGLAGSIPRIVESCGRKRQWDPSQALHPSPTPHELPYEPPTTNEAKLMIRLRDYRRTD
jgi:hypothetical protein